MGKISDALKKVMQEREQRKTQVMDSPQVLTEPQKPAAEDSTKVYIEPVVRSKDHSGYNRTLKNGFVTNTGSLLLKGLTKPELTPG